MVLFSDSRACSANVMAPPAQEWRQHVDVAELLAHTQGDALHNKQQLLSSSNNIVHQPVRSQRHIIQLYTMYFGVALNFW